MELQTYVFCICLKIEGIGSRIVQTWQFHYVYELNTLF